MDFNLNVKVDQEQALEYFAYLKYLDENKHLNGFEIVSIEIFHELKNYSPNVGKHIQIN